MGNSGTSTRLLMGLIASHAITATFVGDASLSKRPMARVAEPVSRMGASFTTSPGDRLPLTMPGACPGIGRESGRERVWQYVYTTVVAVALKKTQNSKYTSLQI